MKLLSSPLERQQNGCGHTQPCGKSVLDSATPRHSPSAESNARILVHHSYARSLLKLAAVCFVGSGFLSGSLSMGEEPVANTPKIEKEREVGHGITILKALYGSREQFANGKELDVTEKAKQYVVDGKLHISHTRKAFGDPHPNAGKILRLTYLVNGIGDAFGQPYEQERAAGTVSQAVPDEDGNRPRINHVYQGEETPYCNTACILMAAQAMTGFILDGDHLLPEMSGLYRADSGQGKSTTHGDVLLYVLNIDREVVRYDADGLTDITARPLALEKLKNRVIPELDSGNLVLIAIRGTISDASKNNPHAILLSHFDHDKALFVANDPVSRHSEVISLSELMVKWPYFLKDELFVYCIVIKSKGKISKSPRIPPVDIEQNIDPRTLAGFFLPKGASLPINYDNYKRNHFFRAIEGAKVIPISSYWESGRKAEGVKGIPLWLKIKVAAGDPACLFWDDGKGGKRVVAVTGYRGGYKNFDGEMQITEIGEDGKFVKTWIKSAEVLQKGKSSRDCGGDSFYIIYPKKPLVESAVASETKNDNK